MANTQAMCTTFKRDILNGLHAFGTAVVRGTSIKDSFKAALYLSTATKNAATSVYDTVGEVSGTNYAAGGVAVTTATTPTTTGTTAFFTPSASLVFTNVTLSSSFDAVMIYNDTSSSKLSVSVHTFTPQTITAGTLTLTMPVNDSTNALIRIA